MSHLRGGLLFVLSLVAFIPCGAQNAYIPDAGNVGLPANGVFSGGSIDSVQLQNGNLHVDIPLLHLSGVGMDTDIHFVYDNQVFNVTQVAGPGSTTWNLITMNRMPARVVDPLAGIMKMGVHQEQWECGNPYPVGTWDEYYINYMNFEDANGTSHTFPVTGYEQTQLINGTLQPNIAPCLQNIQFFPNVTYSDQFSGYQLTLDTAGDIISVIGKDGRRYFFGSIINSGPLGTYYAQPAANPEVSPILLEYAQQVGVEDSNGNQITGANASASGCASTAFVLTDSMNRTITECPPPNPVLNIPFMTVESDGRQAQTINYTDQNGSQTITLNYSGISINLGALCGTNCGPEVGATGVGMTASISMPTSIVLRNGDTYDKYTINYVPNDLGEIDSIVLPTGGKISYTWGPNPANMYTGWGVASRTVTQNGQPSTWQFTYVPGSASGNKTSTVTDPYENDIVYTFGMAAPTIGASGPTQEVIYSGLSSAGTPIATKTFGYTCYLTPLGQPGWCTPVPTSEVLTWNSSGQTTETDLGYDFESVTPPPYTAAFASMSSWGNLKSKIVYDYGTSGSHGPLLSNTQYSYLHETNGAYIGPNIADRLSQVSVYNSNTVSSSSLVAQTTTGYDSFSYGGQSGLAPPGWTTNHDSSYGASATLRGLPTSVTKYVGPSSASITTYANYNTLGQPTAQTDGRGYTTTNSYLYGASGINGFSSSLLCPSLDLLTISTMPSTTTYGITVPHKVQQCHDVNTGLLVAKADQNNPVNATTYTYDSLMRPLVESRPDGGTTTNTYNAYSDANHVVTVVTEDPVRSATTTVTLDGVGRKSSTATTSDNVCGPLTVNTYYDLMGRVQSVSNPHCSSPQVTNGYTTYTYDALGRLTNKQNPDGWSQKWNISGSIIDFYDETNRHWQHTYDAGGRLTKVLEPDGTLSLTNAPTLETDYSYDTMGNLFQVDQRGIVGSSIDHVRKFAYDAAGRLIASNNPENASTGFLAALSCTGTASGSLWTTCYSYDSNSNLVQKTDNRGISVNYSYDALNRLTGKTYSDSTPPVSFAYDVSSITAPVSPAPPPNLTGELTQATVSAGSTMLAQTNTYSYDPMGRLQYEEQCTPANCTSSPYQLAYTYDLAGKPTSETFPSNAPGPNNTPSSGQPLILTYSYDSAERLLTAGSNWVASNDTKHPATLFQASTNPGFPAYGPVGLQNATIGINPASGTTTATLQRGYDDRGRTVNGFYSAGAGSIADSTSTGSIVISGTEAPVTQTGSNSSVILSDPTQGMQYGSYPSEYWNSSAGQMYCQTDYYSGTVTITIQSSPPFTVGASWGQSDESQADVRSALVAGLNATGTPVTATFANGSITLTSVANGFSANYPVIVSLTQGPVQQGTSAPCN